LKIDEQTCRLLYNLHHIISDGWSVSLVKKDFLHFYQSYVDGSPSRLNPLTLRYKDFACWHNHQISDRERRQQSHLFWRQKVEPGIPVLTLPLDSPRTREERKGAGYQCILGKDVTQELNEAAVEFNTTLFVVMFSIYIVFLHRFSNQQDISCSIIHAGREHETLRHIVGFFVHSLLFTLRMDPGEPFRQLVQRVNREVFEIFFHQSYPLELVFKELNIKYPQVPVSFNMLNLRDTMKMDEPGSYPLGHVASVQDVKFDLEPYVAEY
ncbi:MAG: hypothetical protein GY940_04970, partial [bacterium]|nr:hypothetical protein [bacterium]